MKHMLCMSLFIAFRWWFCSKSSKKKKEVHDLLKTFPIPFDMYTKTSDPFYLFFMKCFENYVENLQNF